MKDSGVPWLRVVPQHWDVAALRHRYSQVLGKMLDTKRIIGSHPTPYLRNTDVQWDRVSTNDLPTMDIAPSEYARYTVRDGDLLVCEGGEVGRCAIWTGQMSLCGFQKALHRLRPLRQDRDVPRFMYYALYAAAIGDAFNDGHVSTISHLTGEKLRASCFPFPPFDEQSSVVRFLDHAGSQIRGYIGAKQNLIRLLEEQRQVTSQRAVTRGLDSGVRFKPVGESWLGNVPAHWQIVRAKRLFTPRTELARPTDVQLSATQAFGVIPQAEYERRVGRKVVRVVQHLEKRRHVEIDDFVISMRSFQGGLERAWASGCIRSSYVVLRPSADVSVGYFGYLLKSPAYIGALQSTANFIRDGQDLNFENFCAVNLPLPSMPEQRRIAAELDRLLADTAQAIDRARSEINLLKEYWNSLAVNVVTGKLDVRIAAANLPQNGEYQVRSESADCLPKTDDVEAGGELAATEEA